MGVKSFFSQSTYFFILTRKLISRVKILKMRYLSFWIFYTVLFVNFFSFLWGKQVRHTLTWSSIEIYILKHAYCILIPFLFCDFPSKSELFFFSFSSGILCLDSGLNTHWLTFWKKVNRAQNLDLRVFLISSANYKSGIPLPSNINQ